LAKPKIKTHEAVEVKQSEGVIFMKANRPLTVQEHKDISGKLKAEEERTGLKFVLVPFSLDVMDGENGEG
jgi:hypothetical protein